MSRDLKESDWKTLRQLHPIALERFCQRALDEIQQAVADTGKGSHARFVKVIGLVKTRRREMQDAFDDMRRSRAFQRVVSIQSLRLLTDEEMDRFSPEFREAVRSCIDILESDGLAEEEDDEP